MNKLILVRHGESEWNRKNIFTGWVDIPLSKKGIEESFQAGQKIADLPIDCIYTSTLIRAIMTAMIVMSVHGSGKIPAISHAGEKYENWTKCAEEGAKDLLPTYCAWQLNERMYGNLQGCNKQKIKEHYGEQQFKLWRRSYDIPPPQGESLEMTATRSIPYFKEEILPKLHAGQNIFIAAHGNSLRSIIMNLDNLSKQEVLNLELETGLPIIYAFQGQKFTKIL